MKIIGLLIICYVIYVAVSVYGFSLHQINQSDKDVQSTKVKSLDDLSSTVMMNESVAITSKIEDGLVLRGELIDQAETTLSLAQYKISDDDSGLYIIKKIEEAAKRGVNVQILVNGLSSSKRQISYLSILDEYENVEIKVVGGINLLKPWEMNNVLHDKLILVDDTYMLSSGRNISNRFMIPSDTESVTEDMDIVVKSEGKQTEDSLISQGRVYYDKLWQADYAKNKKRYDESSRSEKQKIKLDKMNQEMITSYADLLKEPCLENMTFSPIYNGYMTFNETNSIVKEPIVWKQVSTLINEANKQVDLMSPYVVLSNKMFNYLEPNDKRELNIITNSGASSPNVLAFGGYLKQKNKLLSQANIWEFQSKNSIHQKALLVDEKIIGVGSFNVDSRSTFFSSENMLLINSPMAAKELEKVIHSYEDRSLEADSLFGYKKSEKNIEESLSTAKRLLLKVISFFSPFFRIFL
ncbi:phospholipase D-like domain-containing protein [Vagococcus fluvialis]|uniref:phospholipase D-like domain-containing protein n=1 Tax=Vagococcus fluvialis TaxID=2738 RepID=UPI003B5A4B6A